MRSVRTSASLKDPKCGDNANESSRPIPLTLLGDKVSNVCLDTHRGRYKVKPINFNRVRCKTLQSASEFIALAECIPR